MEQVIPDDSFLSALQAYTAAALEWLSSYASSELRLGDPWRSVVEADPEEFLYPDPTGQCAGILHHRRRLLHAAELHTLPEYVVLADLLEHDERCSNLVGRVVYSGGRGRRLFLSDFTDAPLLNMVSDLGKLAYSEDVFQDEYSGLVGLLQSPTLEHARVTPLLSFHCDIESVELDQDTSIQQLSPAERRICGLWGYSERPIGPWWGVRFSRRLPKFIGGDDLTPPTDGTLEFNTDAPDVIHRVIAALRLLKEGVFCAPGLVNWSTAGYERYGASTSPFFGDRRSYMDSFGLGAEEATALQLWWTENHETMQDPLVAYPLSRFSLCSEAQRPEERLVNLAICAESLLLRHDEKTELTHRLALRAAFLLEEPDRPREPVYRFFKRVYDARSEIVHGNELAPSKRAKDWRRLLRHMDGTEAGPAELGAEFAGLLRELLGMALSLVPANTPLVDEADRRIFAS